MLYAEVSYFDGYHFQHIAAWEEERRFLRLQRQAKRANKTARGAGRPQGRD